MTAAPDHFLTRLTDALRLAALRADEQVAALPSFVHVPDEIALLFDDAWVLVPQVVEAGLMTDAQLDPVTRLDRQFSEMTDAADSEELWTIEAMRDDPRWHKARELAHEALTALGQEAGAPSLNGITWIGPEG